MVLAAIPAILMKTKLKSPLLLSYRYEDLPRLTETHKPILISAYTETTTDLRLAETFAASVFKKHRELRLVPTFFSSNQYWVLSPIHIFLSPKRLKIRQTGKPGNPAVSKRGPSPPGGSYKMCRSVSNPGCQNREPRAVSTEVSWRDKHFWKYFVPVESKTLFPVCFKGFALLDIFTENTELGWAIFPFQNWRASLISNFQVKRRRFDQKKMSAMPISSISQPRALSKKYAAECRSNCDYAQFLYVAAPTRIKYQSFLSSTYRNW